MVFFSVSCCLAREFASDLGNDYAGKVISSRNTPKDNTWPGSSWGGLKRTV
jgi:hypothetical protein